MRIFAFFLPQFHEIKENNEWWGQGFTEWTNVKKAKPLYKGHVQPICPLNGYYNLLEKDTVLKQTFDMKKYGIDGFIYYHYYFNGRMLLEKPAENLLKWKDIDQPFFFCWANHDWNRSWEGKKEVLLKQEYGNENDWEQHFQYLLPFFEDSRYEKKDNMPLFMIFKSTFNEREKMFEYLDRRCKEAGFNGLYLIECYTRVKNSSNIQKDYIEFKNSLTSVTKDVFFREPDTSSRVYHDSVFCDFFPKLKRVLLKKLNKLFHKPYLYRINSKPLFKIMIKKCSSLPGIHGVFFSWDNTPRHKERGYVLSHVTKKLFDEYMDKIKNDQYLFVNAWNEWAEGMVLEPTVTDGYKNLEWIAEWKGKNA